MIKELTIEEKKLLFGGNGESGDTTDDDVAKAKAGKLSANTIGFETTQ